MDYILIHTHLKASGDEYKKIVFWNRFIRNKTELILTFLPAIASIILFAMGFNNSFMLILYVIFFAYPVLIFTQFNSNIAYHLKHRDESESAPCDITLMKTSILAEIPDFDLKYNYSWDTFTTIYDKLGYYMFFEKGKMILMLKKADIPSEYQKEVVDFIFNHVDMNKCYVKINRNR